MKKKMYFCDIWDESEKGSSKLETALTWIALLAILVIIYMISYHKEIVRYEYELNSYSQEEYEYLNEVADTVISEGKNINISAIPANISKYEIKYSKNEIVFEYSMNNSNKIINPSMTVYLTKDFTILSKIPYYSSEESYKKDIKRYIRLMALNTTVCEMIVLFIILILIIFIAYRISKKKKFNAHN